MLISAFTLPSCQERHYQGTESELSKSLSAKNNNNGLESRNEIQGDVIKITDGDTFTLLFQNGFEVKIRLVGIDSPEKKQAFSTRAKQTLSELIFSKTVKVLYDAKDRYGRVLGEVYVGDLNVNQEMVRRGFAWHFKRYSNDPILAELETKAKENKVGLWRDPNPIPPWEYRKR